MVNNQKYGIEVSDIEGILSIFKGNVRISRIILFGSRAKGIFTERSDVDIAISGDNLGLKDVIGASLEIDQLYLPYKVDIIIFDRIKEDALIGHINRVGIVLFEKKKPEYNTLA